MLRYFDGFRWTEQLAPMGNQQQAMPPIFINNSAVSAPTVVVRAGTNHALHLILTLLTCGLWLPVWIIVAIANS